MTKKNKYLLFFLFLILILFFLKIDYRYKSDWTCCSDEFDYYAHIKTIVEDKDFDYINQFGDYKDARNIINDKPTPIGFIGTSFLTVPFYIFGKFLSNFENINNNSLNNFEIAMTSLSSTFYLFLTFIFFIKISNLLNFKKSHLEILLLLLGSGLTYFAFERYLMPHVFEVFTITLVFYFAIKFFKTESKVYISLLPYAILLALLVRWTNYHVLLVPVILKYLFFSSKQISRYKGVLFVNSTLALFLFLQINKLIYGTYTLNPLMIYSSDSSRVDQFFYNLYSEPITTITYSFKAFLLILFGPEFGLLWFSPIIFLGIIKLFLLKKNISTLLIFLCFAYQFSIVILWGTAASSYGFRYLLCLIPFSYIVLLSSKKILYEKYYIYIFSFFGFISTLLFETTNKTQLSINEVINSFGTITKYAQPDYLYGVIEAVTKLDSWIIVFATSLLFSLFLKLIFLFIGKDLVISQLAGFGLPVENKDFETLLYNVQNTPNLIYLAYVLFTSAIVLYYISFRNKTLESKL